MTDSHANMPHEGWLSPEAEEIRRAIEEEGLHEGDIVTVKYQLHSHSIPVTGKLGRSKSAPYLMQADGTVFRIEARVKFTQTFYIFASIDRAVGTHLDDFLRSQGIDPDAFHRSQRTEVTNEQLAADGQRVQEKFKAAMEHALERTEGEDDDPIRALRRRRLGT